MDSDHLIRLPDPRVPDGLQNPAGPSERPEAGPPSGGGEPGGRLAPTGSLDPEAPRGWLGPIVGVLVLIGLISFGSLITVTFGLALLEEVADSDSRHRYRPMLRVWTFEELTDGSGDADALRSEVRRRARWFVDDGGASGRMALPCTGTCPEPPAEEMQELAVLFRDSGYALDEESVARGDFQGRAADYWLMDLIEYAWLLAGGALPFFLVALLLRRSSILQPPLPGPRISAPRAIAYGLGLAAVIASAEATFGLLFGSGGLPVLAQEMDASLDKLAVAGAPGLVLALLAGMVAAPLAEEYFFRGWVLPYLDRRIGPMTAYLYSSGLWAIAHHGRSDVPWIFATGLLFAWSYRRWGSLVLPITAHAAGNALAILWIKINTPPF